MIPIRWIGQWKSAKPCAERVGRRRRRQSLRVSDRVARTQMTVGLYAVQLLTDAGRVLNCGKLRTFAEKVWAHGDFVRQYCDLLVEDSVTAEFAARVVVAFGEPDRAWVLQQAYSPVVDPQTLWTLLDQINAKTTPRSTTIHRGNQKDRIRPIHQFSRSEPTVCTPFSEPMGIAGCAPRGCGKPPKFYSPTIHHTLTVPMQSPL